MRTERQSCPHLKLQVENKIFPKGSIACHNYFKNYVYNKEKEKGEIKIDQPAPNFKKKVTTYLESIDMKHCFNPLVFIHYYF